MKFGFRLLMACVTLVSLTGTLTSQNVEPPATTEATIAKAYGAVALVTAARTPDGPTTSTGAAVVVRPNGVLLTADHLVKDAYSVQVRFKNGEVYDQVQLLGVDTRRDVAAIKVVAAALPAMPVAIAAQAKR